jgi:hypothetical protein
MAVSLIVVITSPIGVVHANRELTTRRAGVVIISPQ